MKYQLYTKIRDNSKYLTQNSIAEARGQFPFPVEISPERFIPICDRKRPGGSNIIIWMRSYRVLTKSTAQNVSSNPGREHYSL